MNNGESFRSLLSDIYAFIHPSCLAVYILTFITEHSPPSPTLYPTRDLL